MKCKQHCSTLIFLLSISLVASGQGGMETYPKGARSVGMANAHVGHADAWAIFNNVGALGRLESNQVLFGYDHRLGISELTTLAAGVASVHDFGVIGLGVSHFGGSHFNQKSIGIGFSNTFGIASFGFKINYFQTNIEGFGRSGSPVLEFGGLASLGPDLFFAAHIYNLSRSKFSKAGSDYLPTVVKAGLSYRPSEKLIINVEAEKDIILPPQFKMGMEYNLLNRLWARSGIQIQPNNLFFGMGFKPSRFQIDYALSQNYRLGYTHHFSFNYLLDKE